MNKKFNLINKNVIEFLEGGTSVLPSRYNYINLGDYLNERHGDKVDELTAYQLDEETIKFIGLVISINNKSSDILIPIPEEEKDVSLNTFLEKYKIEKFDSNFNYYNNRTRTPIKELIVDMYNSLKVDGSAHYNFSYFDMRPLI